MKKIYFTFFALSFSCIAFAQTICNSSGNLLLFSNYDGGNLNISVDVNIPNLKIGVCSYEGTIITISGAYASNVTGVAYAGFNSSNVHCGSSINTSITGAGSATTNISIAPAATLVNANGYTSIIGGASCSNTTNQGGINTVDQIENYFLTYFPGSTLYSHKVQYGCWSGTQAISTGGTCCPIATSVDSNTEENSISVYPNPTTNSLSLSFEKTLKAASIKIISVSGQLIKEEKNISGNNVNVSVSDMPAGLYFIETNNQGSVSHSRFIKK